MRQSYSVEARRASWTMSTVPMAYICSLVSERLYVFWNGAYSPFEVLEDEMAAVNACHPALAEHERVADRLEVFWYQVLVVFTIEEDVGEDAEPVLIEHDQPFSRRPRPGLLTKRPRSWDVGKTSVHTMFSLVPDKAQKGPSRSRTWNNRTAQLGHGDEYDSGGPKAG